MSDEKKPAVTERPLDGFVRRRECAQPEKLSALIAAKAEGKELEFWGNDEPKCPHCGRVCVIGDLEWYKCYDEGEHEQTCPSCDNEFTISTRVSFTFSTDEQPDEDGA